MSKTIAPFLKVARSHAKRLQFALDHLKNIMPIDQTGIKQMDDMVFMYFEVLTNRFIKIHDFLGSKIFDLTLEAYKESFASMSMIDKLNRLEKIRVIDSVEFWDELRDLRNHLTHEYPAHPELTAKYLNHTYRLAPQLIKLTEKIVNKLEP